MEGLGYKQDSSSQTMPLDAKEVSLCHDGYKYFYKLFSYYREQDKLISDLATMEKNLAQEKAAQESEQYDKYRSKNIKRLE